MLSCRYCSMYAPDLRTPLIGHCAAFLPPRPISMPYHGCPFDNDPERIKAAAHARGFDERILRSIVFVVSDGAQISRPYRYLADLRKEHPNASHVSAIYYDFNNIAFHRAEISPRSSPQLIANITLAEVRQHPDAPTNV